MASPAHSLHRPILFIDVQHGLCNRLRAMASAAALAAATDRQMVVIWRPDHHCEARIGDLLRYTGPVIEDDAAEWYRARSGLVYNYMEVEPGAQFEAPILAGDEAQYRGDLYIRSAYPLSSPHLKMGVARDFLRQLVPTIPVLDMVRRVRHPNDIALHIRMQRGRGYEHLPHEAVSNWPAHRHQELAAWREKTHRDNFIRRVDALVSEGAGQTMFLAADTPDTYAAFAERYGDRVAWLDRDMFDRSPKQLQYALADLLLLTAARHFLGSPWSSFTDVAQQLARPGRPFERSGRDF